MKKQSFWKKLISKKNPQDIDDDDIYPLSENVKEKSNEINPFISARRVYNDQTSSLISSRSTWQIIGILSLIIAAVSVCGMAYLGAQPKFVPYVVQVDKLGEVRAAGVVQRASKVDPRIIKYTVTQFVTNARMVTVDAFLQKAAILNVYSHLNTKDPSYLKMERWYNETPNNSPFARAKKELVSTKITSVLQLTNDTWQVDWKETTIDHSGKLIKEPTEMRALITVYVSNTPLETEAGISQDNPLNIYVKDLSWSQMM